MNITTPDNFEAIAKDAVASLIGAAITVATTYGDVELARTLADEAEAFCKRAIAIGGV